MKKLRFIHLLLLLLLTDISMSAYVFIEKEFIEKYDIDSETKSLKSKDATDFWANMLENNLTYSEFVQRINANKNRTKDVQNFLKVQPRFSVDISSKVLNSHNPKCESFLKKVGLTDSITCCIIDDSKFQSSSFFSPEGHVVVLTSGVIDCPEVTDEMIVGMLAHEYAHILLSHVLWNRSLENEHDTNLAMGIIYSFCSNYIALPPSSFYDGSKSEGLNIIPPNAELEKYVTKYFREPELEADLIAYRFMEWSGIGGEHYIKLLRLMGSKDPENYRGDPNSFYTNYQERISFLNYVRKHPEIGNKVNAKLRKKMKKQ